MYLTSGVIISIQLPAFFLLLKNTNYTKGKKPTLNKTNSATVSKVVRFFDGVGVQFKEAKQQDEMWEQHSN